jgi:putative transposase
LKRTNRRFTVTRCIRIALDRNKDQQSLTSSPLAQNLIDSARLYEAKQRCHIILFLLMPDHLHALVSFASDQSMSRIVGDWKHFHTRKHGILWQDGFFDHRLRDDERGEQLSAKMNYIRQNPVAAGLSASAPDWPWVIESCTRGDAMRPLFDAKNNIDAAEI